ncbi:Ribosome-releasing factor 2, mitochondrial, partial [Dinochytrium kinnereticum]
SSNKKATGASKKAAKSGKAVEETEGEKWADLRLDTIPIPPPVFVRSVEPLTSADERKLEAALSALSREDPSLSITVDPESGQTLMGGMGELHLEISEERLRDVHKCSAKMGKVMISYRETLDPSSVAMGEVKKMVVDREVFGKRTVIEVRVCIEPNVKGCQERRAKRRAEKGTASEEEDEDIIPIIPGEDDCNEVAQNFALSTAFPSSVASSLASSAGPPGKGSPARKPPIDDAHFIVPSGYPSAKEIRKAVDEGMKNALMRGPLAGLPLANIRITCKGLRFRSPEFTSTGGIRAALARSIMASLTAPSPVPTTPATPQTNLVEPVMRVSVTVPERYLGPVTKDLTGTRRGDVISAGLQSDGDQGQEYDAGRDRLYDVHAVEAIVPLSSLVGYSTALRGLTAGTGGFSMRLLGYRLMAGDREGAVVREIRGF